jgi:hypothetical protein
MDTTTVGALKTFLTEHTEQAKKVIRDYRLKNKTDICFKPYQSLQLAYFDGNKDGYRTVKCNSGDPFYFRSFYIGKKGDVIFIFHSPKFSNSTADRIEIKLEMAFLELPPFAEHIFDLFGDLIKESLVLIREAEVRKSLMEKAQHQLEQEKIKEAKAAKYAGKLSYGAW